MYEHKDRMRTIITSDVSSPIVGRLLDTPFSGNGTDSARPGISRYICTIKNSEQLLIAFDIYL